MDNSMIDMSDNDEGRSSSESSESFSFATAMVLRKNLTEVFDKQVVKSSSVASEPATSSKMMMGFSATESASASSSAAESASISLKDRIARFQQAVDSSTSIAIATQNNNKPPLANKKRQQEQNTNNIPENQVSVYLRIRPPLATPTSTSTSTGRAHQEQFNTIEVLPPSQPNLHPTIVRTYPPAQSNASKVIQHRIDSVDPSSCAKEFEFHQVLEPETTQKSVYSTVAAPLVDGLFAATSSHNSDKKTSSTLTSESALLFAYGITNAGKTHTIHGNIKSNNDAKWGLVPRAISDIFDRIKQLPKNSCIYDLYLSYFEIYNEQIYDLLPRKSAIKNFGPPPMLKLREREGQTIVRGLAKHQVRHVQHGIDLAVMAHSKRRTASNNLNSDSSRSHCICQLQLVPRSTHPAVNSSDGDSVECTSGYSTDEEAALLSKQKNSTLWIVDLAGSERSKRTGLASAQQKEASMINKSLMTLNRCLSTMRESQKNNSAIVVPFRESKLTHLFMSHLTGPSKSRTSMVVNVNPAVSDFDETQHVLAYAAQARMIQMDHEQLQKKRKLCFGDEYGMDGHKTNKQEQPSQPSRTAHITKLVTKAIKKFSPKNMAKKSERPVVAKKTEKRKAEPVMKLSHGMANCEIEPLMKRMRHPPTTVVASIISSDHEKEIKSLKMALSIAQTEAQIVQSEKERLVEELDQKESQVRIEVAEEMEEQMKSTREEYNQVIERLRSQIHSNPIACRSTRKAQIDKAEHHIEELMDKVDECEEEMVRMRMEHAKEVVELTAQSQFKPAPTESNVAENENIARLERELEQSRAEVAQLQKSKVELIENYEKLLQDDDNDEEEEEEEDNIDTVDENIDMVEESENIGRTQLSSKKSTRSTEPRQPLSSISANVTDSPADANGERKQWVFPSKPLRRDNRTGVYRRPSGRAPSGREWDGSVGAWRVDAV
jgi:hypothetical protein